MLCKVKTPVIYMHTHSFICFSDLSKSETEEIPKKTPPFNTSSTFHDTLPFQTQTTTIPKSHCLFNAPWAACIPHTVRTLSLRRTFLNKKSTLNESLEYTLNIFQRLSFKGIVHPKLKMSHYLLTHVDYNLHYSFFSMQQKMWI